MVMAMCYRLQWCYHLQAQGLWKGNEHPDYSPLEYGTCTPITT